MGYFARERILRGCGPNLHTWTAVFSVDDFTDAECQTLAASVQHCLDELHDDGGHGPWHVEFGPSAAENAAVFVNLKSEWATRQAELVSYREAPGGSWLAEVYWLHEIAVEHANIIRDMRGSETPVVYLQCDVGGGFETFECLSDLTWDELESLETLLSGQLYDAGIFTRLVRDWHAEREPVTYVQARLSWKEQQDNLRDNSASDTVLLSREFCSECIAELKALRSMPVIYGSEPDDQGNSVPDAKAGEVTRADGAPHADPSEVFRAKYRDPDNYWRNVWLYQQRAAGKTNPAIIAELADRAVDFEPLESENALRAAIDSIATLHGWKLIKGRVGRPKSTMTPNAVDNK